MPNNPKSTDQNSDIDSEAARAVRWDRSMDICIVFCFVCVIGAGVTTFTGHRSVAYGAIVGFVLGGLTIAWLLSLPVTLGHWLEKADKE